MKQNRIIGILIILIMAGAALAAGTGIFSDGGPGPYPYTSIRGEEVTIYGQGLYRHMSADVAVQGIGQDYITLFIAVPLLGVIYLRARKGYLRSRIFLAGLLGYFLVTYLFYLVMGMYNILFLLYTLLLGISAFAFILTVVDLPKPDRIAELYSGKAARVSGAFLVFNTLMIAGLWLGVVLPPLQNGSLYPAELNHYTTLIVQGLDLGLLLPLCFVTAILMIRRRPLGILYGTVYLGFLTLLMTALCAKLTAMALTGVSTVPAIFIIPVITLLSLTALIAMLRGFPSRDFRG